MKKNDGKNKNPLDVKGEKQVGKTELRRGGGFN